MDIFSLWERMLSYVHDNDQQYYGMFLSQIFPCTFENGVFTVKVSKPYLEPWLNNMYRRKMEMILSGAAGAPVSVRVTVNAETAPEAPLAPFSEKEEPPARAFHETPAPFPETAPAPQDPPIDITKIRPKRMEETKLPSIEDKLREARETDPREISLFPQVKTADTETKKTRTALSSHTFENFVAGNCNRMAYEAALSVAQQVSANDYNRSFNPLFIYGPSGLGKTHLLHAIENYVLSHTKKKVIVMPSETFVNELISAIRSKTQEKFRTKYRTADVLLLDDVQFFGGADSSSFELFNTFNVLFESHKNIVMTSDTTPENIKDMEDRLKSRFASGLVVQISPPDFEICCAILQSRALQDHIDFPSDAVEFIAKHINKNIRELEGAYNTVVANARLLRSPITLDLAKKALQNNPNIEHSRELTIDLIIDTVCRQYDVQKSKLVGKSRPKNIVIPRQIAMYLCRTELNIPFQSLVDVFHKKDHTSVLQACKRVEKSIAADPVMKKNIDHLKELLKNQ